MASKKHRPEEALAKLRQVDVLVSQGQAVAEAIGVTEVTYDRWRREFGGLTEVNVAVHALNRMLELGRPRSVRIV